MHFDSRIRAAAPIALLTMLVFLGGCSHADPFLGRWETATAHVHGRHVRIAKAICTFSMSFVTCAVENTNAPEDLSRERIVYDGSYVLRRDPEGRLWALAPHGRDGTFGFTRNEDGGITFRNGLRSVAFQRSAD